MGDYAKRLKCNYGVAYGIGMVSYRLSNFNVFIAGSPPFGPMRLCVCVCAGMRATRANVLRVRNPIVCRMSGFLRGGRWGDGGALGWWRCCLAERRRRRARIFGGLMERQM